MKVVIDCNIFVVCITSKSKYHPIFTALKNQLFELIITNDILFEYEEIIQLKYGIKTAKLFKELINELNNVSFVNIYYNWDLIKQDTDDNKYCDALISGVGDYLVTNDKHFDILKKVDFPKIDILNIDEFMEIINNITKV